MTAAKSALFGIAIFALEAVLAVFLLIGSWIAIGTTFDATGASEPELAQVPLSLVTTALWFGVPTAFVIAAALAVQRWLKADARIVIFVAAVLRGVGLYWFLSLSTFINCWLWDVRIPLWGDGECDINWG